MTGIIDWIETHTPAGPRVSRVLDLLLPLLVAALLVTTLAGLGRASDTADEAKTASAATAELAHRTARLAKANRRIAHQLHAGLVGACQKNGNPLRAAVRTLLKEQIALSQAFPATAFPGISASEFHELLEAGNAVKRRAIKASAGVDCRAQYRVGR